MKTTSTIKIHSIELNNFKCYQNKVTIQFENNLQGIIGLNGSGKSTLISAIEILFNPEKPFPSSETTKKRKGYCKMFLHPFNRGERAELELTRDSDNNLFIDGEIVTSTFYKETINSLNLSTDLVALYIIKQNNIDNFLNEDLIPLFDQVSGLNEIKEEINHLKDDIDKQETNYFRQFQQRKGMQKHREKIREEQKELDLYKELDTKINTLQKEKKENELKKELLKLKTSVVELQNMSTNSQSATSTYTQEENELKNAIKEHNIVLKEIDENQNIIRNFKITKENLDETIRKEKAQKLTLFSTIQNMTTKLGTCNLTNYNTQEIKANQIKYSKLLSTISKTTETEFNDIKSHILNTKELKEITESIAKEEEQLSNLKKKLSSNKLDLGKMTEKKNVIKADFQFNKEELNKIENKLNDRETERDKLRNKEEILKQKQNNLMQIKSDIENRKLLNSELEELKINSSLGKEDKILNELMSVFGAKKIIGRLENLFNFDCERDKFIVSNVFGNHLRSIIVKDSESVVEMINFLIQRKYKKEKFVPLTSVQFKERSNYNTKYDVDECGYDYSGKVGELIDIKEHYRTFIEEKYKNKLNFNVVQTINEGLSLSQNRKENCVSEDGTVIFSNGLVKSSSYNLSNIKDKRRKLSNIKMHSYEDLMREINKNNKVIDHLQKNRVKVIEELNDLEEEISFLYKTESIDELNQQRNSLLVKTENLNTILERIENEIKLKEANISSLNRKIETLIKRIKEIESLKLNKNKKKSSVDKELVFELYKLVNADSEDMFLGFNKEIILKILNDKLEEGKELENKRKEETIRIKKLLKSSKDKLSEKEEYIKSMINTVITKEKEIEDYQTKLRNNYRQLRECERIKDNLETEIDSKKNNKVKFEKETEIREIKYNYNIKESIDNLETITKELKNILDIDLPTHDTRNKQNVTLESYFGITLDGNNNETIEKLTKNKINRLINNCSSLMDKKKFGRAEDMGKLNEESINIERSLNEQLNFFSKLEPNFRVKLDAPEIERTMVSVQKEFMECRKSLNLMKEKLNIKTEERKAKRKHIIEAVINKTKEIYNELSGGGLCTFSYINEKIVYRAMPVGKKSTHATELSGGERTVAALSLIIALSLFKEFSILILDEIDSALDNDTIERVASLLKRISSIDTKKQIILVSHKLSMYSKMDSLIGVYYKKDIKKTENDNLIRGVLTLDLSRYPGVSN